MPSKDLAQVEDSSSLAEAFLQISKKNIPNPLASQFRLEDAAVSETPLSQQEFRERALKLASALREKGVSPGVRVAILSNTREEWSLAEFATYLAGGSVVTLYTSDPPDRIGFVLNDASVRLVVAENQEMIDKVIEAREHPADIPATEDSEARIAELPLLKNAITLEEVDVPERYVPYVSHIDELIERSSPLQLGSTLQPEDEATIIYTSGTTGLPKGVVATHGQHLANLRQINEADFIRPETKIFHILPQAHGFGMRMVHMSLLGGAHSLFATIVNRQKSTLDNEAKEVLSGDFKRAEAEVYPVVPKILGRMRQGVQKAAQEPGLKGLLLRTVVSTYTERARAMREGNTPPLAAELKYQALRLSGIGNLIRKKVQSQVAGPNFRYFISGGAKLPMEDLDFFTGMGMPILEGYGSTETNVPISVNTEEHHRAGSVGKVLDPTIETMISPEGELLIRGPNVAREYLGRPTASAKTWDADRWYHTKDLGSIDDDGFIYIQGRVDDVLVTTSGENIQAPRVERRIAESIEPVSDLVALGDGRSCLTALVILNRDELPPSLSNAPLNDEKLKEHIRSLIEERYHSRDDVLPVEKLRDFLIIPEPKVGEGYTATLKLQRKKLMQIYSEEIEQMYDGLKK